MLSCLTAASCSRQEEQPSSKDDAYFSSYTIQFSADTDLYIADVVKLGDNYCTIMSVNDADGSHHYEAAVIDPVKKGLKSSSKLELNDVVISFCPVSDTYIACAGATGRICIVNAEDGSLHYEGIIDGIRSDTRPQVAECDEGFIYVTRDTAVKIEPNGKELDRIEYELKDELSSGNAVFSQDGRVYLISEGLDDLEYYLIDFDKGKLSPVTDSSVLDADAADIMGYGQYIYKEFDGELYKADMKHCSKELIAYKRNMLIKPSMGYEQEFYFLDDDTFAITVMRGPGLWEVIVIEADGSLDIGQREVISVKGDNAIFDKGLMIAAYNYNMSQQDYYVVVENWGGEYGWSTSEEAEERNLRLIQQLQSGDSPDILYGYTLDHDYLGRAGVVIDMMPYIENSEVINKDNINSHLYDVMTGGGKCYELFCGYYLNGLFCSPGLIGNRDIDYEIFGLPAVRDLLGNRYRACDYLNFMIGYPMTSPRGGMDVLGEDHIRRALEMSVELGNMDEQEMTVGTDYDVGICYQVTGSLAAIKNMADNNGGHIRFIGFPSPTGSSCAIQPIGLTSISAGSAHPDACFSFLEYMYSDDAQRTVLLEKGLPLRNENFDKYVESMCNPDSVDRDDYDMMLLTYELIRNNGKEFVYDPVKRETADELRRVVDSVDMVISVDFGVYNIMVNETNSYYMGKSLDEIAKSLNDRLTLYYEENY